MELGHLDIVDPRPDSVLDLHDSAGPPTVWMYWDHPVGVSERPAYLELCEDTVKARLGALTLERLNIGNLAEHLGPLPDCFEQLSVVHRADYARAHVVARHGGIWLDSDTVVLKPIEEIWKALGHHDFLGYGDDGVHLGLFAAHAGSRIAGRWAAMQDELLLRADPGELGWTALGSDLLEVAVQIEDWVRLDYMRIAPIGWRDWQAFFSRVVPLREVLADDPYVVALYNAVMGPRLRGRSRERVVSSHDVVGRLLRHADGGHVRYEGIRRALRPMHRVLMRYVPRLRRTIRRVIDRARLPR